MNQIENVECFTNCTQLCKPHESNKAAWEIYQNLDNEDYLRKLEENRKVLDKELKHKEFI
jgi:hypothetical protein